MHIVQPLTVYPLVRRGAGIEIRLRSGSPETAALGFARLTLDIAAECQSTRVFQEQRTNTYIFHENHLEKNRVPL